MFYKPEYRLTTKEFVDLFDQLKKEEIGFAYVNVKYHRLGNPIWDYEQLMLEYPGIKFAIAYDDDMDDDYEGHK